MSEINVRDIIKASGFRFNKALGQNFLSDVNLLDAIVKDSGVSEGDIVVEIGTGAGTLTRALAKIAKKVYSFEVDTNLQGVLALSLQGMENVEVIFKDVLKMSDGEIADITGGTPFKFVANLPYYITTPLVMRFLESGLNVESLTVTVQKEVADRFTAKADTSDYSAITLAIEMRGEAEITRKIDREMFFPSPNVDSAVVRIDVNRNKLEGENFDKTARLVRAAFSMRRKTLANNISSAFHMNKGEITAILEREGYNPFVRGEALALADYVKLSRVF